MLWLAQSDLDSASHLKMDDLIDSYSIIERLWDIVYYAT